MSLAKLNELALERFKDIRDKRFGEPVIAKNWGDEKLELEPIKKTEVIKNNRQYPKEFGTPTLDKDPIISESKIERVLTYTNVGMLPLDEMEKAGVTIDTILDFVTNLKVSNNIKLSICNLISLDSKNDKEKLELVDKTIQLLKEGVI